MIRTASKLTRSSAELLPRVEVAAPDLDGAVVGAGDSDDLLTIAYLDATLLDVVGGPR